MQSTPNLYCDYSWLCFSLIKFISLELKAKRVQRGFSDDTHYYRKPGKNCFKINEICCNSTVPNGLFLTTWACKGAQSSMKLFLKLVNKTWSISPRTPQTYVWGSYWFNVLLLNENCNWMLELEQWSRNFQQLCENC